MRRLLLVCVLLAVLVHPASAGVGCVDCLGVVAYAQHVGVNGSLRPLPGMRLQVDDLSEYVWYAEWGYSGPRRIEAETGTDGLAAVKIPAKHEFVWAVIPPFGYSARRCRTVGVNGGYGGMLMATVYITVTYEGDCGYKGAY